MRSRCQVVVLNASGAGSVHRLVGVCRPTTRRERASVTDATHTHLGKARVGDVRAPRLIGSQRGEAPVDQARRTRPSPGSTGSSADGDTTTPEQVQDAQRGMYSAYLNGRTAVSWVDTIADVANERSDIQRTKERARAGAAFAVLGAVPHPAAAVGSAAGSAGLSLLETASSGTVTDPDVRSIAYNASITEVAVQNGLVDESYFPDSEHPQPWYDPKTKTVTIADDDQRDQLQEWWAEYYDDIGPSEGLMGVSLEEVEPQDTDLPED